MKRARLYWIASEYIAPIVLIVLAGGVWLCIALGWTP